MAAPLPAHSADGKGSSSHDGNHVLRWRSPLLGRTAFGESEQLTRQDLAPDDDAGIGTTQIFVVAISDTSLSGLHGDVLHTRQCGVAHFVVEELATPDVLHDLPDRRCFRELLGKLLALDVVFLKLLAGDIDLAGGEPDAVLIINGRED